METISRLLRRLWYLMNRARFERDLEREMASHRALMAEPHRFGNAVRLREASADVWGWTWLDDLGRDLRYAARQLRRSPRFTCAAIAILTLGAGVALSVLHVANAVTFHMLSIRDTDALVRVSRTSEYISSAFPFRAASFYRAHNTVFSYLVSESLGIRVSLEDDVEPVASAFVSGNYFDDLKVIASQGRLLAERDAAQGAALAAVLGHKYWQRHFASDQNVVGRVLRVNSVKVEIVGVLPSNFDGVGPPRATTVGIWFPMAIRPQVVESSSPLEETDRADTAIYGVLAPGITMEAATAQLRTLTKELQRGDGGRIANEDSIAVVPLQRKGRFEADVALLFTLFFLIFFSACANLGNMLLARGVGRSREIEMRLALGAGPSRVIRQLVTENLLLAVLGGATGAVSGYVGARLLLQNWDDIPPGVHIAIDWRMVFASIAIVLVAMSGFGLAPAIQAVRRRRTTIRSRQALVAVQVAASCVLLILASLLTRSSERLGAIPLTFDYEHTFVVDPQFAARTLTTTARWAVLDGMSARLEQLAGVDGVAAGIAGNARIGPPFLGHEVSPSYFDVLALPIVRGRRFFPKEPGVILLSESAARAMWPDRDPLGQTWTNWRSKTYVVVGIVKDSGLSRRSNNGTGEAYVPLSDEGLSRAVLFVHTNGNPSALLQSARAAAALVGLTPTATMMRSTLNLPASNPASLIGILGSLATLLAFIGIFGLISFAIAQRTREIGVRMALGAKPVDIVRTLLAQYALPLGAGCLAGVALAVVGALALRHQLYGLGPLDPASYIAGLASFGVVAIVAVLVPARRAVSIDPSSALRSE